jgi:tetratricopeptide (TPR) repeat protein
MIHSELVLLINNFNKRYIDSETTETMLMYQQMNNSQSQLSNAKNLLLTGIDKYQKYDDYHNAIELINESIKNLPSAAGYFNRGTIHWCEKNFYDAFKDHCSSLILEKNNYPLSYFYLANSLYELAGQSTKTTNKDELIILNLVIEMLIEGKKRGESNAEQMLPHAMNHQAEINKH